MLSVRWMGWCDAAVVQLVLVKYSARLRCTGGC
jgi:hypothetical protein